SHVAGRGEGGRGPRKEKGSRSCLSRTNRRTSRAFRLSCCRRGLGTVALAEFLNSASGVQDLLLARVERVADRANFHMQRLPDRRAGFEDVSAAARDFDFAVFGVDAVFHDFLGGGKAGPST